MTRALVFTRTKHGADRVVRHLAHGAASAPRRSTATRARTPAQRALANFKSGKTPVLVATDIAARGIDIDDISHVVNYDLTQRARDVRPPHRPHGAGRGDRARRCRSATARSGRTSRDRAADPPADPGAGRSPRISQARPPRARACSGPATGVAAREPAGASSAAALALAVDFPPGVVPAGAPHGESSRRSSTPPRGPRTRRRVPVRSTADGRAERSLERDGDSGNRTGVTRRRKRRRTGSARATRLGVVRLHLPPAAEPRPSFPSRGEVQSGSCRR